LLALLITAFFLRALADTSLSPCSEFSSSYSQQLHTLNLPLAAQAAAAHATSDCLLAADSRHFLTRCYALLYRWCNGGRSGRGEAAARTCSTDWHLVAGLHRVDTLQELLRHATHYQRRVLQSTGSSSPGRALIYKPSPRGEGWGNRVMALTAAYAAALLSRRTFHVLFDPDDAVLSSIDFKNFPTSTVLGSSSAQRRFPCLSLAAALEDPPLNFVRPDRRRDGGPVSWVRPVVVSGLDDEVAWLGSTDEARVGNVVCPGSSLLYVSGAPAMHHARDHALRATARDHGGVWGSADVVIYSAYDSFWGALLDRPATGLLLKRLLLPASLDVAARISWPAEHAHLRCAADSKFNAFFVY
jgi:hypothetical protein